MCRLSPIWPWRAVMAISLALIAPTLWARPLVNNTVYEVFVRSFYDGNSDVKRIGDLKGLIQKLDYLNDGNPATDTDLEVGILWLMPTFPTTTYHGYDVKDYRGVNPDYGTLSDMRNLVTQAHKRGMRVILDVPLNHTSNQHPWFLSAVANQGSYRSYYFMEPDLGQHNDWSRVFDAQGQPLRYFSLFGSNMPDLNWNTSAVRQEAKNIAKFWMDIGIDGFRLDAAKHLAGWNFSPTDAEINQNNVWWRDFSKYVYRLNPEAVLIGEVLGDHAGMVKHAPGLNGLLDEQFMNNARTQVDNPSSGFVTEWKNFVAAAEGISPTTPFASFPYLSSHDRNPRLMSDMLDSTPLTADASYRAAMCLLMSMGKFPMLYYGDEIGQKGWKWGGGNGVWDETLREPFPWSTTNSGTGYARWQPTGLSNFLPKYDSSNDGISVQEQSGSATSTLSLVRALTNLRNQVPELADGEIGQILSDTAQWKVFERTLGGKSCLVLVNLGSATQDYLFHSGWYPQYVGADMLFWSNGQAKTWANLVASPTPIGSIAQVPGYGMLILRAR